MKKSKEQITKDTQDMAKKIGHCLCNLKLECPCEDFVKNNVCECSEYFVKKEREK